MWTGWFPYPFHHSNVENNLWEGNAFFLSQEIHFGLWEEILGSAGRGWVGVVVVGPAPGSLSSSTLPCQRRRVHTRSTRGLTTYKSFLTSTTNTQNTTNTQIEDIHKSTRCLTKYKNTDAGIGGVVFDLSSVCKGATSGKILQISHCRECLTRPHFEKGHAIFSL